MLGFKRSTVGKPVKWYSKYQKSWHRDGKKFWISFGFLYFGAFGVILKKNGTSLDFHIYTGFIYFGFFIWDKKVKR